MESFKKPSGNKPHDVLRFTTGIDDSRTAEWALKINLVRVALKLVAQTKMLVLIRGTLNEDRLMTFDELLDNTAID